MQLARPGTANDPRRFGRRARHALADISEPVEMSDLKLFATTFVGGFLFVSLLLA